jgi:hypothetical protein
MFACGGADTTNNNNTKIDTTKKIVEPPRPKANPKLTAMAQIMGGIDVTYKEGLDSVLNSKDVKLHHEEFNRQWANLETKFLAKMRPWRDSELADFNSKKEHTLFYPFSGPDILNAYELFPNADNYLMFGLELDGKLAKDATKLPKGYLGQLRTALSDVCSRNYFITSRMGTLYGGGVLPIMSVFVVRTDSEIVDAKRFYVDNDGKPVFVELEDEKAVAQKAVKGVMIEFIHKDKKKSQKAFFIGKDASDNGIKKYAEMTKFIQNFPNKIGFIKSASYILHNADFSIIRNLLLDECSAILQDDTGIRYSVYKESGWDVKLYGKYGRPISDFGVYTFQPDVDKIYKTDSTIKKLDFTFGYHWVTKSKTNVDMTSVFVARKPEGAKRMTEEDKKAQKAEPKKEEKKQENKAIKK